MRGKPLPAYLTHLPIAPSDNTIDTPLSIPRTENLMSQLAHKRSHNSITAALVAAAGEPDVRPTTVGIWVVWLHAAQVIHIESTSRLDIEVPVAIILDADEAVLVAVAPRQFAGPVLGRVDVIHQYLIDKGVPTHAVYLHHLAEGAWWTTLPGGDGGIVPPLTAPQPPPRRSLLPRLGHRIGHRGLVAAIVPVVAVLCMTTAAHAAPSDQPGVVPAPGPGQAGVTATVIAIAPQDPGSVALTSGDNPAPDIEAVAPQTQWQPQELSPEPQAPVVTADAALTVQNEAPLAPDETSAPSANIDSIRIGVTALPRPGWMPPQLAEQERNWDSVLAPRAAQALDAAGPAAAALAPVVGTDDSDTTGPVPDELSPVAAVLQDSNIAVPPLPPAAAVAVAQAVPAVAGALGGALAQLQALPGWRGARR